MFLKVSNCLTLPCLAHNKVVALQGACGNSVFIL